MGPLSSRIHFLGHALEPERYPPTDENIENLIRGISRDADGFFEHVRLLREEAREPSPVVCCDAVSNRSACDGLERRVLGNEMRRDCRPH